MISGIGASNRPDSLPAYRSTLIHSAVVVSATASVGVTQVSKSWLAYACCVAPPSSMAALVSTCACIKYCMWSFGRIRESHCPTTYTLRAQRYMQIVRLACYALLPAIRHPTPYLQRGHGRGHVVLMTEDMSFETLRSEMNKRGIMTTLDEIEADGPSAFKDPRHIVEYVMLGLQHRGPDGIAEAYRFTMPPASERSTIHGTRTTGGKRISWLAGRVIEGTATGRAVDFQTFEEELRETFSLLCGCASWRFAAPPPDALQVPGNEHKKPSIAGGRTGGAIQAEGWTVDFLIEVDDRHSVLFELVYDWGAWCYCIVKVTVLPSGAS